MSIVPLEVTARTAKTESNINKQKPSIINVLEISERLTSENEEKDCNHHHQQKVLENIRVDVSGLTCDQRKQVKALVKEEISVFSVDDDDIGNVTSHQTEIQLNDKTPVQQHHNSIPRTLHHEFKNYVEKSGYQ